MEMLPIRRALISVYNKNGLLPLAQTLQNFNAEIYSTGGTADFLESYGFHVIRVESVTGYPSIFGGRVKTLHPAVFGGILMRKSLKTDLEEAQNHNIPPMDLVAVDLYPFNDPDIQKLPEEERIEKIDIGGISLIRAAAKNFKHVLVAHCPDVFPEICQVLEENRGAVPADFRKNMASKAFAHSMNYDAAIWSWMSGLPFSLQVPTAQIHALRYGENPHQTGCFISQNELPFRILSGKPLSYNNLLDVYSGMQLLRDLPSDCTLVLKHNNPCGCALDADPVQAFHKAWNGDPVSAFGGIICSHHPVDIELAQILHPLFFEILLVPGISEEALELLSQKKNRVLLIQTGALSEQIQLRNGPGGWLVQEEDRFISGPEGGEWVCRPSSNGNFEADMELAERLVKHARSNAVVLVRENQQIGLGCGMVSRIDALAHAIRKAKEAGHELQGAVMGSDAFFPFSDAVELAQENGIAAIWQPGGSIRDQEVIEACIKTGIGMKFGKIRHFKH